jgi:hypothetical protein
MSQFHKRQQQAIFFVWSLSVCLSTDMYVCMHACICLEDHKQTAEKSRNENEKIQIERHWTLKPKHADTERDRERHTHTRKKAKKKREAEEEGKKMMISSKTWLRWDSAPMARPKAIMKKTKLMPNTSLDAPPLPPKLPMLSKTRHCKPPRRLDK